MLKLLLELRQLGFDHGKFAVAILEDGVGATKERELLLLVLRAGIDLRGQLVELEFEFAEVGTGGFEAVGETGAFDLGKIGGVFSLFFFRTQIEDRLLRFLHALVELAATGFLAFESGLLLLKVSATRLGSGAELDDLFFEAGERGADLRVVVTVMREREVAEAPRKFFVAQRLGSLAPERTDLAGNLGDDVGDAHEVGVGKRELGERLFALRFVFGDAGGLFENGAAFLGFGGEDLVDLALRHDRVGCAADAGIHEQLLNVLQAAGLTVEKILALAVAINTTHDLDLVKLAAQLFLAVGEEQRNFAELGGFAGVGAFENDVLHLAAAECLGGLFTQHPADGVGHVGFAAAVGPDDRGHARLKAEGAGVRKRLKTVELESLEIHEKETGIETPC